MKESSDSKIQNMLHVEKKVLIIQGKLGEWQ